MADILDVIVAYKRQEVENMKELCSPRQIHEQVEQQYDCMKPRVSMCHALLENRWGIIAEFKRKSPSKGWIAKDADAEKVPMDYENSGAAALSILTDGHFFGGSDHDILRARRSGVALPVLYKNFIVDEYQLFQALLCGASAVLLIAAVLPLSEVRRLTRMAHELGLEVLLELHAEQELDYVAADPDMCGVNNRNLGSFVTDVSRSFDMAAHLPSDICKVSESGISDANTLKALRLAGFNGFLIGEHFMRTGQPASALGQFIRQLSTL
ncbi:MAG: indole-3-glycerol phosphate synthase TrpC [Prevotella sp.]